MKDHVEIWNPEPLTGGQYAIWDVTEMQTMWLTRTTPVQKYVDDISFEFNGDPDNFQAPGCTVNGKSRSQTLSYYDYNTNYCNMWNLI